jgi:2-polyprenyl-3-methyl-5-hydroxy-6-metoxy-1,4-benzoquinol methylase
MTAPQRVATPRDASNLARKLYAGSSGVFFWMQRLRPHICPFDRMVTLLEGVEEILDVGCGAGLLLGLWSCSGRARRGVGFDASRPAIEAANLMKPRATALGSRADLAFQCIAPGRPWPNGQFDAVTVVDVMHHVPPAVQRSFFRLACDRVKPGGRLLYKDMSARRFFPAAMNRLHELVMARQWIHYLPPETVEQWAKEDGLPLVSREARTMLLYDHDLLVFRRPR